jgi:hypothetical protein
MSGVAVTSLSAARTPTIKPKDPLGGVLPGPPSATREFERGDTIALFAEFYENDGPSTVHTLDFKAELREEGGQAIREQTEQRSSSELQGKAGGYGFSASIPLDGVPAGLYVLHVAGQSRAGDRAGVSRDILIRVR